MPSCAVCTHPKRREIDERLLAGSGQRDTARHFGISKDSISRHANEHIAAKPRALDERRRESYLELIAKHLEAAQQDLASARTSGNHRDVAAMWHPVFKALEIVGRVTPGVMPVHSQVTFNLAMFERLGVRDEAEAMELIDLARKVQDTSDQELEASLEAVVPALVRQHPEKRGEYLERWFGICDAQAHSESVRGE